MKKIAVVLSGCGNKDGSEITEAVSALIALSQSEVAYEIFAPQMSFQALNFLTGEPAETRDVLAESARIARGKIRDLKELNSRHFDGLVFPGGLGAATHLSSWGQEGAGCRVHPEVERVIKAFHQESKPITAICIAPTLVARVLGREGVSVTIGHDRETAQEIEKTGAQHVECRVDDYVSDREHKVITTPAYMYADARPHEIFKGIQGAIKEFVEMA